MTVIFLLILRIPPDIERRAHEVAERGGRLSGIAARLAAAPQVAGAATRLALQLCARGPVGDRLAAGLVGV